VYAKGHDPHYKTMYNEARQEALRISKRAAALTDLLCKAGRARHNKTDIPPEVLKWWEEHCKLDRLRGEPW
jgi:hypothetical protein